LVESAKVYWRDSGILQALTGLPTPEQVLDHPFCAALRGRDTASSES
jgi:hypothetical protein